MPPPDLAHLGSVRNDWSLDEARAMLRAAERVADMILKHCP